MTLRRLQKAALKARINQVQWTMAQILMKTVGTKEALEYIDELVRRGDVPQGQLPLPGFK